MSDLDDAVARAGGAGRAAARRASSTPREAAELVERCAELAARLGARARPRRPRAPSATTREGQEQLL